jgi:fermentation-respiration switch protein FrsA (DUF1100 family)
VLIGLVLAYVGVIVVLLWLEKSLIFHPAGPNEWQQPPDSRIEDVELTTADGTRIHGWWLPRPGAGGAILYLHGNAGNLSWRGAAVKELAETLGQAVLIIDYPGYGKSGGKPSEAGCYAAADAACAWLTDTRKVPGDNVIIYGASLGGGVAVDLASRRPHRALVLVKTFTSAPDVGRRRFPLLPVHLLMQTRFDSLSKLPACTRPIFLAHGDADEVIPYDHSMRLLEAAPGAKEFLPLPGADHNSPLPPEFFRALKAFLDKQAPLFEGLVKS